MPQLVTALIWSSAIGCGMIGGLYFAFSAFVMAALGQLEPAQGAAAMNAINAVILRSLFLPLFLGTTLASLGLGVYAALRWGQPGSAALLAAGLLHNHVRTVASVGASALYVAALVAR